MTRTVTFANIPLRKLPPEAVLHKRKEQYPKNPAPSTQSSCVNICHYEPLTSSPNFRLLFLRRDGVTISAVPSGRCLPTKIITFSRGSGSHASAFHRANNPRKSIKSAAAGFLLLENRELCLKLVIQPTWKVALYSHRQIFVS